MSKLSERLSAAVEYIIQTGMAHSQMEISKRMKVLPSTLNMAVHGAREPSMELLLTLCDYYPINFWWLRSGRGDMTEDKASTLRKRVAELEDENMALKSLLQRQK